MLFVERNGTRSWQSKPARRTISRTANARVLTHASCPLRSCSVSAERQLRRHPFALHVFGRHGRRRTYSRCRDDFSWPSAGIAHPELGCEGGDLRGGSRSDRGPHRRPVRQCADGMGRDVRGRHAGIRAGRAPRRNQRRRRDGASPRSRMTPSRPSPRAEARRRGRRRLCSPRERVAVGVDPSRGSEGQPFRWPAGTRALHQRAPGHVQINSCTMVTTRRLIACDRVPARRRRRQPELPGGGCVRCRRSSVRCEYQPGELRGVGVRFRVRSAVHVALERDRGDGDDRLFRESLFELDVRGFSFGQPEPPAVVVDHDRDMVRVVEGRRAALERGVVEVPPRRRSPPDQLRELAPVSLVAGTPTLGREVVLVPPLELGFGRQGQPDRTSDSPIRYPLTETSPSQRSGQSAATMSALRAPQSNPATTAVSIPRASMQRDRVERERRLLAVADRLVGEEACRSEAAEVGDDHPVARRRQQRNDVGEAVDVVRPAVQQDDRRSVSAAPDRGIRHSGGRHRSG